MFSKAVSIWLFFILQVILSWRLSSLLMHPIFSVFTCVLSKILLYHTEDLRK